MSVKPVSVEISQLHVKLNEMLLNRCVHFEVSQSITKRGKLFFKLKCSNANLLFPLKEKTLSVEPVQANVNSYQV